MSKETLKLALEAYCKTLHPLWNAGISRTEAEGFFNAGFKAAEALAKQEQGEPVYQIKVYGSQTAWHDASPDAYAVTLPNERRILYTTPQQRKPLTDGQMRDCLDAADQMYCEKDGDKELFKARAIEAAHGIKE